MGHISTRECLCPHLKIKNSFLYNLLKFLDSQSHQCRYFEGKKMCMYIHIYQNMLSWSFWRLFSKISKGWGLKQPSYLLHILLFASLFCSYSNIYLILFQKKKNCSTLLLFLVRGISLLSYVKPTYIIYFCMFKWV